MMSVPPYILLLLLFSFSILQAQQDTSLLDMNMLNATDLKDSSSLPDRDEALLRDRFLSQEGESPFFQYISTKEEIRQNAYVTRAEALKMAPGIRISQPGSAMEGETFLMRGLVGNAYTRILINGIPIKPFIAGGMPIGAQLPVKEAERIEVTYGAGSVLHGADFLSGVVNIITKTSEKPVFMKADLTIGGGLYSGVNVFFGGKLGKGKHILRFNAYGSNTLFDDRFIIYDKDFLFNPATYTLLNGSNDSYTKLPNYEGTAEMPFIANTPHVSRLFGITANYRGIAFTLESLYRRDHSALGYNPLARSYSNPLTYTGEGIIRGNIHLEKNKKNVGRKTDFTYLLYRTDPRSSYYPLRTALNLELNKGVDAYVRSLTQNPDTILYYTELYNSQYNDQAYSGGLRYQFAESHEVHFDHLRHYRIHRQWYLSGGIGSRLGLVIPYTDYITAPVEEDFFTLFAEGISDTSAVKGAFGTSFLEANAFTQLSYQAKSWKISGGMYFQVHSYADKAALSPKISGLIRLTPDLQFWANAGRAYRVPPMYYESAGFEVISGNVPLISKTISSRVPEQVTHFESGLRWLWEDKINLTVSVFSTKYEQVLTYGKEIKTDSLAFYDAKIGYFQYTNDFSRLNGAQLFVQWRNLLPENLAEGSFSFNLNKAKRRQGTTEYDFLRDQPAMIGQIRLIFHPDPKVTIIFDNIWQSKFYTGYADYPAKGFFTIDAQARYSFNERFQLYGKIINLFSQPYAGISGTGSQNDLHYNPQPLFNARLGMVYLLE